jgi:hypothetical protein
LKEQGLNFSVLGLNSAWLFTYAGSLAFNNGKIISISPSAPTISDFMYNEFLNPDCFIPSLKVATPISHPAKIKHNNPTMKNISVSTLKLSKPYHLSLKYCLIILFRFFETVQNKPSQHHFY